MRGAGPNCVSVSLGPLTGVHDDRFGSSLLVRVHRDPEIANWLPSDTIFGVWVHSSGFAIPLVVLAFAGSWGFPVLAGVLAGDIFSAEDRYGTWKTVLTRSCRRQELFVGKVLAAATFSAGLVVLLAVSSVAAGLLLVGDQPLVGLSGALLAPGRTAVLVLAS